MSKVNVKNKKALHEYFILESLEAGIKLSGMEVKSIRSGRVDLGQSFVRVLNGEAFLINANIPPYNNAPVKDYNPTRSRKLLLHKSQIRTLIGHTSRSGVTLVPLSIYEKNNLLKVQIALARSKQRYDKRKTLKEKDIQRDLERQLRDKDN